jgi:hypothetical protein
MKACASNIRSELYPHVTFYITLYQNIFRGEPAISGFDWHITSYHNSSETLAAVTGAGFHFMLLKFHPDHGKLTRFRVERIVLGALFRLAFTTHAIRKYLMLAQSLHSPAHSSIGTTSSLRTLSDC